MEFTADMLIYLGKMAEWLKTEPSGKVNYGEFYASELTVTFDGQLLGKFHSEAPEWIFAPDEKYWGLDK